MDVTTAHQFPCTTCGSDLRFEPGSDVLKCDHCGAEELIEGAGGAGQPPIAELNYLRALKDDLPDIETAEIQTLSCDSCGAQVEFDPDNHATECPFCASPMVTGTGSQRQIKPAALVPFELSEPRARKQMTDWLGALWFAPNGLQEYARKGRQMQGIYVPYWTYDANTQSRYTGQRGTIYYVQQQVPVMVDGKTQMQTRQVQKIRWQPVRGKVARFFDDVLVLASKSLPKTYTDALAPWDLSLMEPYHPEYLAGFRAEGYTVALEEGFAEASAHMNQMITRDVRFDIGGDRQRIDGIDTKVSNQTFKHILLPVWLAAYKYRGKTYRFVVNGQNGTVRGERPYSPVKIAIAVVAGLCIAAALGYAIALNG